MTTEHDKAVLNAIFNPLLPTNDTVFNQDLSNNQDEQDETDEGREARKLEVKGVQLAEEGKLDQALSMLNKAIKLVPSKASPYNNRAQVLRILSRDQEALDDLNKAISLSRGEGRSGCQALCQRGLLYRKIGEQEQARSDFTKAANLGSNFAKQQLIEMNPYAAMCNQMLNEVLSKLYYQDVQKGA